MTNSTYGNFDYELCVKILNLLKVSVPLYTYSFLFLIEQKCFSISTNSSYVCLI